MVDSTLCALEGCNNILGPEARHGQKYCSTECTKRANNDRAIARYHERKRLTESGERRECATKGCKTIIRRTSESEYCDPCLGRAEFLRKQEIRRKILGF